jgi:peptidoglycan/LPS O-acetylase OafA/YrhL
LNYLTSLRQKLPAEITEVPKLVSANYFPALDGLRAIAVMMVILYHMGINHYLYPFHILLNGDFGVDIFFVISGFLITTLLLKEKVTYGSISLKRFYLRRVLRIVPVAYIFLIVLAGLNFLYQFHISTPNFIAAFLFYKNVPGYAEPFLGHYWSLAAEVQFYLIFPYLLSLNPNRYFLLILSIVIIVPVISILGYYHAEFLFANPFISIITRIIMFIFWNGPYIILIGSLFSLLLFKKIINFDGIKVNSALSTLVLVAAVLITTRSFSFYTPYLSEFIASILVAFTLLLNLKGDFLSKLLSTKAFVKTGIISYSLYIWQQPFLGTRTWQPWMKVFSACPIWLFIIVKLIVLFAAAITSYHLIEKPFLKLKRRFE